MLSRLVLLLALVLFVFLLFTRRGRGLVQDYAALTRPILLLSLAFFPLFAPACLFFAAARLPLKLFVDAAAAALIVRALLPVLGRLLPHVRPGPLRMLPLGVFLVAPALHFALFCVLSWLFPAMDVWNQ